MLLCIEKCHSGAWSVAAVANCGAVFRRLGFVAFERSRQHALRGAAPASPATETQGHGPGLHPARGDERPRRASRQRQGPRALLEAPLMARRNPAHKRQRCLRPSALGDVCLHDARFGAHSGATKAHDWMVSVIGPLLDGECDRAARPDTSCAHSTESRQAQANGAAMWRSAIISGIRQGAGAWSLTSASP